MYSLFYAAELSGSFRGLLLFTRVEAFYLLTGVSF